MTEKTTHSDKGGGGSYWRFMAMVSTSTVIMFFLMYANTFTVDDLFWSETRFWMMFVMGAMMMVAHVVIVIYGVLVIYIYIYSRTSVLDILLL